jgi:hypothetical protein
MAASTREHHVASRKRRGSQQVAGPAIYCLPCVVRRTASGDAFDLRLQDRQHQHGTRHPLHRPVCLVVSHLPRKSPRKTVRSGLVLDRGGVRRGPQRRVQACDNRKRFGRPRTRQCKRDRLREARAKLRNAWAADIGKRLKCSRALKFGPSCRHHPLYEGPPRQNLMRGGGVR